MNYTSCGAGLASSFCAFLQFFLRCGVVCAPFSAGRAAALPAGAPGAVKRLPLHAAVHPAQRLLHRHRQRLPQPCTSAEHRHCSALLRSSAQQPAQHPSTPDPAQKLHALWPGIQPAVRRYWLPAPCRQRSPAQGLQAAVPGSSQQAAQKTSQILRIQILRHLHSSHRHRLVLI